MRRNERFEPVAPDDFTTLGGLQQWYQIAARCSGCNRHAKLDRYALSRLYGPALPLCAIGARLTCRACGNKGGNVLMIGTMPRD